MIIGELIKLDLMPLKRLCESEWAITLDTKEHITSRSMSSIVFTNALVNLPKVERAKIRVDFESSFDAEEGAVKIYLSLRIMRPTTPKYDPITAVYDSKQDIEELLSFVDDLAGKLPEKSGDTDDQEQDDDN